MQHIDSFSNAFVVVVVVPFRLRNKTPKKNSRRKEIHTNGKTSRGKTEENVMFNRLLMPLTQQAQI